MPILYQPRQSARTKGKAVCVPHFHEKSSDARILETTGADAVVRPSIAKSPEALKQILDDIGSAGFVLAGSLHAAIVACAYGTPFCYFDGGVVDLPFKWRDFSASVNIGTFFANNVAEGQTVYESLIRPRLRKPLLFPILAAAPFRVQSAQLLKAALHDAERLGARDPIDVGAFSTFVKFADHDIAAIAAEFHRLTLAAAEESLKEERLAHADALRQLTDLTGKYDALSEALSEARALASAAQATRGAATQAVARTLAMEQELQRVRSEHTSLEQSSESRFSAAQKEISYLKGIAEILKEVAEIGRQSARAQSENTRRPLRTIRRIIQLKAIKRGMKLGLVSKEGKLGTWFSRHSPDRFVNLINERDTFLHDQVESASKAAAAAEESMKEERLAHADALRQLTDLTGKYDALSEALSEARMLGSEYAAQAEARAAQAEARAAEAEARAVQADARALAIEHELQRVSSEYTSLEQSKGQFLVAPLPHVSAASHAAQPRIGPGKHVLFVDITFPDPDRDSGSVDSINYVTWLVSLGYGVHFLSTSYVFDEKLEAPVVCAGAEILRLPNEQAVFDFLGREGQAFELFFLSRVSCGGRFLEACRRSNPGAAIIFNTVDLHHVREEREAKIRQDRRALFRSGAVRERELYTARQSDLTIVVTSLEKDILEAAIPGAAVAVMPLFRKVSTQVEGFERRRGIGFIGGFLHAPNVDAIRYFLDEVWPRIHELDPALPFEIAGPDLPDAIARSLPAGVAYKGRVADLDGWFRNVRVTVAPLRYGAGAKGKVASSIVNGVPVIGTTVAFEGMGLGPEATITADNAEAMARDIVRLHSDKAAWEALSRGAHAFGMANLTLEAGLKRFSDLIAGLTTGPALPARQPLAI